MNRDPIYTAGIQKAINELVKQRLVCDGQFGPQSQAAMALFQKSRNIPQTGVYDDATSAILDPFIKHKYLTIDSIVQAATQLGVSKAHIRTVCDVESKGSGFLPDGRVKILFERHHFLASLQKRLPASQVQALMVANPDIINSTPGGYVGNEGEHARFQRAYAIDAYSAMYATSYGLFQLMGFNYATCGYNDLVSFYRAMQDTETNQLLAFVQFNKVYQHGVLWTAMKSADWTGYALHYNGSAYQKNQYDTKLSQSFQKFNENIFAC